MQQDTVRFYTYATQSQPVSKKIGCYGTGKEGLQHSYVWLGLVRIPAWAGNRKHRSIAPRLFHHCCAEQDRRNLTSLVFREYAFFCIYI